MTTRKKTPECAVKRLTPMCWSMLLLAGLGVNANAGGQEMPLTAGVQGVASTRDGMVLPAEPLGADDLVDVFVAYCPELSRSFRIGPDGTLTLPLLHTRLKAAGSTPMDLERELESALRTEHILAEPAVSISVLEFRSRPVSVMGAVNHPLTFQALGHTTLLDAIAKAGGLTPTAGGKVVVTTKRTDGGEGTRMAGKELSLAELLSGAHPEVNLQLRGGEEITVPEGGKIFVAGNVRHPGMYAMQSDSDTTVVKAIALSQGLDQYSAGTAFIYRVHGAGLGAGSSSDPGAGRDEILVPLKKILAHKEADMRLIVDDILYVPTSDGKRMTSRVLAQITGFGQTAGAGLLIYR